MKPELLPPGKRKRKASSPEPPSSEATIEPEDPSPRRSSRIKATPNYSQSQAPISKGKGQATRTPSSSQTSSQHQRKPRLSLPSHEVYSQKLGEKRKPSASPKIREDSGKDTEESAEEESDDEEADRRPSFSSSHTFDTIEGRYRAAQAQFDAERRRIADARKRSMSASDIVKQAVEGLREDLKTGREVREKIRKKHTGKQDWQTSQAETSTKTKKKVKTGKKV